ncbi:tail fiber assembly protein [Collimonas antrihumi]|uniref:tail fiber assembly protein n=1 Tax=Collimonas antrihumi TaxID=1940615 RepID=UPI001B8D2E1C|nr:tail fiber assembly protein [Collimonas antrihumi]
MMKKTNVKEIGTTSADPMEAHITGNGLPQIVIPEMLEPVETPDPFTVIDVRNPMRKPSGIICEVKFASKDKYLTFLARPDDVELHGQQIYRDCDEGVWGDVPNYVPSEEELLVEAENKRSEALTEAGTKISDYQDLIDVGEATGADAAMQKEWKKYRIAVTRVPSQSGYPGSIDWPVKPE